MTERVISKDMRIALVVVLAICLFGASTGISFIKAQEMRLRLMVWSWSPEVDGALERALEEFEETRGVNIDLIRVPPEIYWDELLAYLDGDVPPDVLWVHDDMVPSLVEWGQIIELDPFVEWRPEVIQGIPYEVLERFRFEGRLYGIPLGPEGEFALNAYAISTMAMEFAKADVAFELIIFLRSWIPASPISPPPPGELPDLVVVELIISPQRPRPGDELIIEAVIENVGSAPAEGIAVVFTSDSWERWATIEYIEAGGREITGVIETATTPGEHLITAIVDPENRIEERNEENNEASRVLVVERREEIPFFEEYPTWKMPDPAVIGLTVEPERASPGERVMLRASVSNLGPGDTGSVALVFLVDEVEIAREVIETLGPSEEMEVRAIWTAERPGRHLVLAQLELGEDTEFDRDLGNNHQRATARVSREEHPVPELEVDIIDLDLLKLIPGEPTAVPVIFRNPSFAEVHNIPVWFYIDGERASGDEIDYLPPGEEQIIPFSWDEVTPGEHVITVEIDLPDEFYDANLQRVKAWDIVVPDITLLCDPGLKDRWVSIGPRMLTNGSTGRIHEIAFHPTNPNIIYASTPRGGVWKTTNGGGSWAPLGDKLNSLGGSVMAVDPQHPQIVYYATGFSPYGGGIGIYKSTDGGAHWQLFASKAIAAGVNKLVIRYPSAGQVMIYAATNRGVLRYKSSDPWATTSNFNEWTVIKTGTILDMAAHPTNNSLIYASVFNGFVVQGDGKKRRIIDGLWRTDKGETATGDADWTKLTNGLPYMEGTSLKVDIFKSDPKVLYASIIRPYGIDPIESMIYLGIFRTQDGGDSWSLVRGYYSYQVPGTYNPFIRVHPTNSSLIYYGGVNLYKEYVNSATWKPEVVKGIHADQHGLEFDPHDSSRYYAANDGGMWRCTVKTTGDVCIHRNFELRTVEFYDFDASQTNTNLMIGGTQDNGTILYDGNPDWKHIRGGDGYHSLIAPTNNHVMYSQHQFFNSTARSDDGGKTWKWANKGLPKGYCGSAWITSHPNSAYTVLAQGDQVYVTANGGAKWDPKGPKGSNVKGSVTRVVVQPSTFDWIAGTSKGQIWYTSHGGSPWHLLFEHPYAAGVTRLAFAPTDHKVLYALFGIGGSKAYTRIWRFEMNPGPPVSWSPSGITDNFPLNRTPLVISGDGHRADVAYVGTEHGIYRWDGTKPTYESWQPYNGCLPLARVNDLLVDPTSKELRAATQGRGAWSVITGP